nr:tyrosine-type recombinase/integrase [Thioalkalivibrio sp.]
MNDSAMTVTYHPTPWNKGKLIGQKPPLKRIEIWTLRTRLEMAGKTKERALFNRAIDNKLRGCDLVQLRVNDVARGSEVLTRASVVQQKTREPVRFELTDPTRVAVAAWIAKAGLTRGSYLFPSRQHASLHLSVRQYARIVKRWVGLVGGNPQEYGTHSLRRTKATLIYRRTKNLRVVQFLLGHRKLDYVPRRTMSPDGVAGCSIVVSARYSLDIATLLVRHNCLQQGESYGTVV